MPGLTTDGFQTAVNIYPAPAVPGDFAGANIRANIIAGGFGYVASPAGVPVGSFAWFNPTTKIASQYYQPNSFAGFVHRNNQGLITDFLGIYTSLVQPGNPVAGMDQGDFWAIFPAGATVAQKAYANAVNGALTSAATGNGVSGAITSLSVATTGVMTVVTITGTPLAVGQIITAPGVPAGSYIGSLGTGSGGTGTYNLVNADGTAFAVVTTQAGTYNGVTETNYVVAEAAPAVASVTASLAVPVGAADGLLTVSAVSTGTLLPGTYISASGLPTSALVSIISQVSGTTGGTGTYLTTYAGQYGAISSTTFTGSQGQLSKISSWIRFT